MSYNSDIGILTKQHFGFQRVFFDHYYPAPEVEPIQPPADFAGRADRFVGSYGATEIPQTTLLKIMTLIDAITISDSGDGMLVFKSSGREWRFVEVEPLYFQQEDGPFHILFREDDQGNITHMFFDIIPFLAFEKLDGYEAPGFHMMLVLGCVLAFLSMIFVAVPASFGNVARVVNRNPSLAASAWLTGSSWESAF